MAKKKDKKAVGGPEVVKGKLKIKPGKPAKVVSSELTYEVPLFKVFADQVLEKGAQKPVRRDIIRHNGSVVILAVDDSKKKDPLIVIERQYRHAAGQFLYEVPAGKVDAGEDRLAAAKRELIEETGLRAKKWKKLASFYPSPGYVEEKMTIFLATGLTEGESQPMEDERIETRWFTKKELRELIASNRIQDSKTMIGFLYWTRL